MKLPAEFYMREWRARTARFCQTTAAGESSSQVTPHAQQGMDECQEYCESMFPDDPMEQLECYKQECWS
jgi:hypothetical protein